MSAAPKVTRPAAAAAPAISARGIVKTFAEGRQKTTVLKGVTLDVARSEIVALEGPSGSGKTTLLSIVGCILTPTAGSVQLLGREVAFGDARLLRDLRRSLIGFVFQQFNLFPALTSLENVQYSLNIRGVTGRESRSLAEAMLKRVGLAAHLGMKPRDLSGGQKQRVALARALAGKPKLVLADEPTANLDSIAGGEVLELFQELVREQEASVVIVTHDPRVRTVVDRVLEMRDGALSGGTSPR